MARDLNGTTQYGTSTAGVPRNGFPLTLALRFNADSAVGLHNIFCLEDGGGGEYMILSQDGAQGRMLTSTGFAEDQVYAANTFSTGVWNSLVGVWTSGTSRTCYLNADAVNAGVGTTSVTPGTMSITRAGCAFGTTGFFDGKIAELAAWGATLDANDVTQYHNGVSPLLIRRPSLLFYCPLVGRFSPEIELMQQRLELTLTAAPAAFDHPPVIMPKYRRVYFASAGNQTYTSSINVTAVHQQFVVRSASLNLSVPSPHFVSAIKQLQKTLSTFAAHVVSIVVQRPSITAIAINVTAKMTASADALYQRLTRVLTGTAGLGVYFSRRARWRRRR